MEIFFLFTSKNVIVIVKSIALCFSKILIMAIYQKEVVHQLLKMEVLQCERVVKLLDPPWNLHNFKLNC